MDKQKHQKFNSVTAIVIWHHIQYHTGNNKCKSLKEKCCSNLFLDFHIADIDINSFIGQRAEKSMPDQLIPIIDKEGVW